METERNGTREDLRN